MSKEQFRSFSLSYKSAPVEIREMVALNADQITSLLKKIKEFTSASEALILSTCNRTEIYYSAEENINSDLQKLLLIEKGSLNDQTVLDHFKNHETEGESELHLFRVSMGLEAQVVGDMQISNQVKRAYQQSADEDMAGPFLHRLLHTIFFSNKRVVQETPFRDGAASVSYATVELIEELSSSIIHPKVLILGIGEMGMDVCKNLLNTDIKEVTIVNRTKSKAVELANECGFKVSDFSDLDNEITKADVIVSSIPGNDGFVISKNKLKTTYGFKYFIDMSVPRGIDEKIEEIPGVLLYGIDKIKNRTSEALAKRIASIPEVETIIAESITEFKTWSKEMEVSPTIQKLKIALEKIRQEEISRHLKQLTDKENDTVDVITKNIMQKIMKLPVLHLKAACKRGEAETLIDVLNDLFNLETVEVKK